MRGRQENATVRYACPIDLTIDVIGRKWEPLILCALADSPLNYNTLQALLPGVAHKVLTQQLRDLERHHLIARIEHNGRGGRRVDYQLTEFGRTLRPVLRTMADWAKRHHPRVGAALDPLPVRERVAKVCAAS